MMDITEAIAAYDKRMQELAEVREKMTGKRPINSGVRRGSATTEASSESAASSRVSLNGFAATGSDGGDASVTSLTALLHSLTLGDVTAAKSNLTALKTSLASSSTSFASAPPATVLHALTTQLTQDLYSGSTESAVQHVATYLVKGGVSTGSLLDTSA